jgi:hypothetical protein
MKTASVQVGTVPRLAFGVRRLAFGVARSKHIDPVTSSRAVVPDRGRRQIPSVARQKRFVTVQSADEQWSPNSRTRTISES